MLFHFVSTFSPPCSPWFDDFRWPQDASLFKDEEGAVSLGIQLVKLEP